jgi:2-dehydropantoate 2-reductase
MRIDCVGGGSVGLLLAGRLAQAGCSVTLVTRTEEQADRLRKSGLTVMERDGTEKGSILTRAIAIDRYPEASSPAPEWILMAVKQKDIDAALLGALIRVAAPSTSLCCFQNGIGHLEKLSPAFGPERLFAAVTTEGARRTNQTVVHHTGSGYTRVGAPGIKESSGAAGLRLQGLIDMLSLAGFSVEPSNCIEREIWNKLIINVVVNPLTAILQVPNGKLLESEHTLRLMRGLYEEADSLARTLGIDPDKDLWERLLTVCRATALNRSSMLQDLESGRTTELEWLNGSLLREASKAGQALMSHQTVYMLVKAREELSLLRAVD